MMVSPDQQKVSTRRLNQWIENEKRIVTFRELSREVGCHVNTAKNLLLYHYRANPSLSPTYLLSGPLKSNSHLAQTTLEPSAPSSPTATQSLAHLATQGVRIVDMDEMSDADRNSEVGVEDEMGMEYEEGFLPGNDRGKPDGLSGGREVGIGRGDEPVEKEEVPRWGVVLVQGDRLEEKKELFETSSLSIHIYALSPAVVKDPAQYLVSSLNVREHKTYHDPKTYGTITGDAFKPVISGAMKDGAMNWATAAKKEEKTDVKVKKADTRAKPEPIEETTTAAKPAAADNTAENEDTTAEPAPESKGKKNAKAAPKTVNPKKRPSAAREDETEGSESPAPVAGSSKTPLGPTSSETRADDKAAMEAMMGMDFDMESDDEDNVARQAKGKKGEAATAEVIKIKTEPGQRKRRKVRKTVMETNEKGYMVSKDVWEEEEYSGDSETEPASAAPSAKSSKAAAAKANETVKRPETPKQEVKPAAKPAGGAKKGGQSTLAGFFKKK